MIGKYAMFHYFKRKLIYYFVSPLDKGLDKTRQTNKRTDSQKSEYKEYQRIFRMRDQAP